MFMTPAYAVSPLSLTEMRDMHRLAEDIDCAEHHCDAQPILRSGNIEERTRLVGFVGLWIRRASLAASNRLFSFPSMAKRIQFAISVLSRT
jgi:hypothetical protein